MSHVIVVGSGIAGILAALHARAAGCRVTVVTKDVLAESNTRYAQGGVAVVTTADDSVDAHVADTLTAGAGLAVEEAVRTLVSEGPDRIAELIGLGVAFDRDDRGELRRGLEAAHSAPRILHAGGDATGAAIEAALVARLRENDIRVVEHAFLVDLLVDATGVVGVDLLIDDERRGLRADAVILATGGAGHLYAHTTNPAVATGDGIAAALRAGATVADLEFVQFHPTVLAVGEPFLVSEAVRGEGAILVDDAGRRFAFDAHPDGELAPRDVVARAIARAMQTQHGRPVHLDATALGGDFLAERFPTIDRVLRERGIDWAREPVPVIPAAHYLMGGIATDLFGRTSIPRLYAVGETARTGVHGANRLASNSLLEGAVFGARAGDAVARDLASPGIPGPIISSPSFGADDASSAPDDAGERGGEAAFSRAALQELMWRDAGLVRTGAGLERAASVLARWSSEARAPRTRTQFEDDNLLRVAREVVRAARARTVSVGAHHRVDVAAPAPRAYAEAGASC